jgi:predicted RNA-binding protein with RPS1 domain
MTPTKAAVSTRLSSAATVRVLRSGQRKLVVLSIKEQHHQSPHQHRAHHSRYRERQGFRRFVVTFNCGLHEGLSKDFDKSLVAA